jgi:hypothetical protein
MPGEAAPYLSVVATARNDDHGGNLLGRMQAFVGGWVAQAKRYGIPSELILVEWNPPADRPRLAEALLWPDEMQQCTVRIVEVPEAIHRRYAHAQSLPLYQMIAKNAGIRRARGEFVLATNIDILFSNELAGFFAARCLESGTMYRVDRHDVMSDVPADTSIDEQLAYCRTHLIRVNAKEGTFALTPDGRRAFANDELVTDGGGVRFGQGWYALEKYARQDPFRWAGARAGLQLEPDASAAVLELDVEPGPGTAGQPVDLEVKDGTGHRVAEVRIGRRCLLRLPLSAPAPEQLVFETRNGGHALAADPRELNFRVFRITRERGAAGVPELRPISLGQRARTVRGMVDHVVERLATGGDRVALTVPVSIRMRNLFRRYLKILPATGAAPPQAARAIAPLLLHTNGCGDFTLLARRHWFDLRGYPEFDLFSMNLDSVFCIAAHHGGARQKILAEPMRIYHIEHGTGSGWTPEGQARLFARLAASGIPHLENDEVLRWAAQMQWLNSPMIFNRENWGLADVELKETLIER